MHACALHLYLHLELQVALWATHVVVFMIVFCC
jgi:hypothetical protein